MGDGYVRQLSVTAEHVHGSLEIIDVVAAFCRDVLNSDPGVFGHFVADQLPNAAPAQFLWTDVEFSARDLRADASNVEVVDGLTVVADSVGDVSLHQLTVVDIEQSSETLRLGTAGDFVDVFERRRFKSGVATPRHVDLVVERLEREADARRFCSFDDTSAHHSSHAVAAAATDALARDRHAREGDDVVAEPL